MGVPLGYYSDRIEKLMKRRDAISARIYADRLSLKAIDREIEKYSEAMQKSEDYL